MTTGEHALPHVNAAGSIGNTAKIINTDMLTRVRTKMVALTRRAKYFNIYEISFKKLLWFRAVADGSIS
jgi:hypothetical protein